MHNFNSNNLYIQCFIIETIEIRTHSIIYEILYTWEPVENYEFKGYIQGKTWQKEVTYANIF